MIRINSDFIDYYDHWAAGSWQSCDCVLDRRMDSGPARKEALEILSASGFNVPRNGIVEALVSEIIGDAVDPVRRWMMESINLVVYTDEKAHAGEGKVLFSMESALCDFPKLAACGPRRRFAVGAVRGRVDGSAGLRLPTGDVREQANRLPHGRRSEAGQRRAVEAERYA